MTRSKLSASDREELIRLFKETTETITSLANRFQVSISTARRVLKTQLSAEEYEAIVASRLEGRQQKKSTKATVQPPVETESLIEDIVTEQEQTSEVTPPVKRPKRRSRRRSSASDLDLVEETPVIEDADDIPEPKLDLASPAPESIDSEPMAANHMEVVAKDPLEILPIEAVALPNQCYLVVDRAAELITPPLKEFSELGAIPVAEESAKTLPIFANHKIASRFSRRSQRIIKIPNSNLLKKTYPLLTAKGVERILFDGQVFSLIHSS